MGAKLGERAEKLTGIEPWLRLAQDLVPGGRFDQAAAAEPAINILQEAIDVHECPSPADSCFDHSLLHFGPGEGKGSARRTTGLQAEWARCRDWIVAALPAHLYAIEDIERGIADGHMQFWPGRHCAAVTEFAVYPNCKVLNVLAAGGRKGAVLKALTRELEPCLLDWARASDCKYVMGFGSHEGWKPVTEAMGYALQWLVMIKEVKD